MSKPFMVMRITGGPELAKALREIGDLTSSTTARNRLAAGMVKASQVMADTANAYAPTDNAGPDAIVVVASKQLSARQIKEAGGRANAKTTVRTYVGERAGATIGLINEYGTHERTQTTTGKSVGAVPMRPFMRPAFEATKQQVLDGIVPAVRVELAAAVKRAAKKAAKKAGRK